MIRLADVLAITAKRGSSSHQQTKVGPEADSSRLQRQKRLLGRWAITASP